METILKNATKLTYHKQYEQAVAQASFYYIRNGHPKTQ